MDKNEDDCSPTTTACTKTAVEGALITIFRLALDTVMLEVLKIGETITGKIVGRGMFYRLTGIWIFVRVRLLVMSSIFKMICLGSFVSCLTLTMVTAFNISLLETC